MPKARSLRRSRPIERGHHVAGEPAELLLELVGRQALGPVDHEILEPRVFRLDRLDAVDDLRRRPTEPGFLFYAVGKRGNPRWRPRSAPGAAVLVGIAHE